MKASNKTMIGTEPMFLHWTSHRRQSGENHYDGLLHCHSWLDGDIQMHLPVGALIGHALALVLADLVVDVSRGDAPQGQPIGVRVSAAEIPQSPPQISRSPHTRGQT